MTRSRTLTKLPWKSWLPLFDASSEKFPTCNIDNADLRPFAAHGGKLMIDHGWDDPLIPTRGTIDYYERVVKIFGGKEQVDAFCRLYINMEERDTILKNKGILAGIFTMLAGVIWTVLISEHVGLPIQAVALVSSVLFFFMMLPLATKVKEHNAELKNTEEAQSAEHYSFKDMLGCIKTNKYVFIILVSVLLYTGLQTGGSLGTYASFYLYGNSLILIIPIAIAFIPQTIAQLNTDRLCRKFGKKKVFLVCGLLGAGIYSLIYFSGYHNFAMITVLLVLQAMPGNISQIAKTFFTPDTIEYTRYKTGKDCSGIFFSLNAFVNKLSSSISASLGLFLLGLSEWVPVKAESFEELAALNVTQTQGALDSLWTIYMLIPAIGTILSVLVMVFYKLKDKDVALMAKCNAGEITREECEAQLSGKY